MLWLCTQATAFAAAPVQAMVTVPPQRAFVERIGGNRVAVEVMVPPGSDPHTYEPRPAQLVALARSQVYFSIGDAFENAWLARLTRARGGPRVVRTDEGIPKIRGAQGVGAGGPGEDPHIWLSPVLVKIQARHIREGLAAADPAGSEFYAANFARFAADLDRLDAEFAQLFRAVQGREFVVFHPAWTYFADAYGIKQIAVEVEGKSPTPVQMQSLLERMRAQQIRVVFAQPQRSMHMAETIAASVGARVIVADDLAANWEDNLRSVAHQLRDALGTGTP